MKQHQQRGIARFIVLAVIVLASLSGLARCDIQQSQHTTQPQSDREERHAPDYKTCCGRDSDLARVRPVRHGV